MFIICFFRKYIVVVIVKFALRIAAATSTIENLNFKVYFIKDIPPSYELPLCKQKN
jgi:hypothetical protein